MTIFGIKIAEMSRKCPISSYFSWQQVDKNPSISPKNRQKEPEIKRFRTIIARNASYFLEIGHISSIIPRFHRILGISYRLVYTKNLSIIPKNEGFQEIIGHLCSNLSIICSILPQISDIWALFVDAPSTIYGCISSFMTQFHSFYAQMSDKSDICWQNECNLPNLPL